jgi:antitoxin FitA
MRIASMPTLQIRDLPEDVYEGLAAAAQAEQRSLAQQAVVELRRALGLDEADRRIVVVEQLRASGRRLPAQAASPESLQREDRNAR